MNEEIAVKYLGKALSIGIEEGYVRSFVDELSPMVSLLKMFVRKYKKAEIWRRMPGGCSSRQRKLSGIRYILQTPVQLKTC